jgi:hypothetical protein
MKYDLSSEKINIDIGMINGDLKIISENRTDIEIDCPGLRRNSMEEIFDMSYSEGKLYVSQKGKKLSQFASLGDMSVMISLPQSCALSGEIRNISGDIEITGIDSVSGSVKTKSGDITVKGTGKFEADLGSISGEISVSGSGGALALSTISGDISVAGSEITKLSMKSISGDLKIEGAFNLTEDAVISTVSGDAVIDFGGYTGDKRMIIKTVSGDVELTGNKPSEELLSISQVKGDLSGLNNMGKEFFSGAFGSAFGSVMKNLKTHIKNVSSDKTDERVTEEIKEAGKDDMSVQTILKMVSDGKISVDDAEKLIRALK